MSCRKSWRNDRKSAVSSGAKIQIKRSADIPLDVVTRHVELVGTNQSIDKAEQLIKIVTAKVCASKFGSWLIVHFSFIYVLGESCISKASFSSHSRLLLVVLLP